MGQEFVAQPALPPDDLTRHHLFDVLAGNPPGAFIFLLAARNTNAVHHYLDLGKALVQAEDLPKGKESYGARLSAHQTYKLSFKNGYFRAIGTYMTPQVNSDFLLYKQMLATTLLDIEIDFPQVPVNRIVGRNIFWSEQVGIPSLSMALYRMLLSSPDRTIPRLPTIEDFVGQSLLRDNQKRVYSRIKIMQTFGIIERVGDSRVRICENLLPFITTFLQRMDTLHENAENPTTQQVVIERAEEIVASPTLVRAALRKAMRPPPLHVRQERLPKLQKNTAVPEQIHPSRIKLGTYPWDWFAQAACKDANPNLFILGTNSKSNERRLKEALRFCARCPVRAPCLKQALLANDQERMAAFTPDERAALTEEQKKQFIEGIIIIPFRAKGRKR